MTTDLKYKYILCDGVCVSYLNILLFLLAAVSVDAKMFSDEFIHQLHHNRSVLHFSSYNHSYKRLKAIKRNSFRVLPLFSGHTHLKLRVEVKPDAKLNINYTVCFPHFLIYS